MKRLLFFAIFLTAPLALMAQDTTNVQSKTLTIGVTQMSPFVEKNGDDFSGLSVTSWEMVNEDLEVDYQYKEYNSLADLLDGVSSGEVDMSINPITVTNKRMEQMNFSQPYYISHTAIAKRSESKAWRFIKNLWTWDFLSALLMLIGVIFIFGLLVWIFERKKNHEEFGGNAFNGIKQGFWWSAVTMTTVGYGDKSPRTTGGRVIGLIWMFVAIILISSLTAGIASALTVQSINDDIQGVQDLNRFEVATVNSSSSQEFLNLYNVNHKELKSVEEGFQALTNEQTALFVYDEPILKHMINKQGIGDDIEVLPNMLKKDYFAYAFPKDSKLIDRVDPVLIGVLKTMEWNTLLKDF